MGKLKRNKSDAESKSFWDEVAAAAAAAPRLVFSEEKETGDMSEEEKWGDWTPREILDKIENEGLAYFFCHYTYETFEGSPLEEPVKKLRDAINEIEDLLLPYSE